MIQIEKIAFIIGSAIIMLGMIVILSSTTVFGSYALWYVGQNMHDRNLAPQQILLIMGASILVGGLYIVIKSKPRYTVNQGNHELK